MPVDPNKISLISIKTLKGNIEISNIDFLNPTQLYHFEFGLNTQTNLDRKLIRIILEVQIKNVDSENKPTSIAGSYTHEFIFRIDNLYELIESNPAGNHEVKLNYDLGVTLTSIAYSTLRGILHMRTQGTVFNGIILPVIAPASLMQKTNVSAVVSG